MKHFTTLEAMKKLIKLFLLGLFILTLLDRPSFALRIKYFNSNVWVLKPSSEAEVEYVETLRKGKLELGVFFWNGNELKSSLDEIGAQATNYSIAVFPPVLENSMLNDLSTKGIACDEFIKPSIHDFKRLKAETTVRTYVKPVGRVLAKLDAHKFKFDTLAESYVAEIQTPVDIMNTIQVPNNSSATVTLNIDESLSLSLSLTLEFSETLNLEGTLSANVELPGIGGGGGSLTAGISLGASQSITLSGTKTYTVSKTIEVPPMTSLSARGYVKWLENAERGFQATAKVTLQVPSGVSNSASASGLVYCPENTEWNTCNAYCGSTSCPAGCPETNTCSCCNYPINNSTGRYPPLIRDYLISTGYPYDQIETSKTGVTIPLSGTATGSYGQDVYIDTRDEVIQSLVHKH